MRMMGHILLAFLAVSIITTAGYLSGMERLRRAARPLPEGELRQEILMLARRLGVPLREVMVLSTRRPLANAFSGLTPDRIYLTAGVVGSFRAQEVLAVVAHELGHLREGHLWKRFLAAEVILLGFLVLALGNLPGRIGMWVLVLLGVFSWLLFGPLSQYLELRADRVAVWAVGSGPLLAALGRSLKRDLDWQPAAPLPRAVENRWRAIAREAGRSPVDAYADLSRGAQEDFLPS